MRSGAKPVSPESAHFWRTQSGVRQHVPVLMAVDPPTRRPMGMGIAQLPIDPVAPLSR
jgi:hypothetical protein